MWIWLEEQRGGQRKCWSSSTPSSAPLHSSISWCSCTSSSLLLFFREPRCVEVRTLLVTILRNNTSFPESCPVGEPGGGWRLLPDADRFPPLHLPSPPSLASGPAPPRRSPAWRLRWWTGSLCWRGSPGASGQCQPVRPPPTWPPPTFCCPSWLRWRGPRRWGLWRVQSPDNDTQFSLGDPPGPSFLHFCSYPKIWWWVCITLESCQENGLWMSYF